MKTVDNSMTIDCTRAAPDRNGVGDCVCWFSVAFMASCRGKFLAGRQSFTLRELHKTKCSPLDEKHSLLCMKSIISERQVSLKDCLSCLQPNSECSCNKSTVLIKVERRRYVDKEYTKDGRSRERISRP